MFYYVLVVLVLLCIACSDCLANKESGNGENQNYNYEDDMRYPISGQVHTEESHGGQQMSSAVAPEEVEALLGGNDEAEQRKQVNNNESNNAAPVSVVAKPHCKANHAKDDKNGTYNIVPAKVLTNKLEGANLFKAETIAISVSGAAGKDKSKAGKNTHFKHNKNKCEEGINTAFNLAISKFHLSCTLLVFFMYAL